MGGYGYGFGGFGLGWIWMLLPLLLIVGVVYFIIKGTKSDKAEAEFQSVAILKERFARGEISEEEYKRMKNILGK
ncbi:SHOCT domain-containing protein [Fodinisporobacter ferrooxydans]|uniref:SHOCT domain-containing protein n=1 Tax=Fodinisporobacter ferrooxydans TaxID=2901836 RepID=A0ABY4CP91_9BACL|nr:SHOCT domain-containing protein [Alicyclobacillaceae bacterium MYW30-H2]